MPDVHRWNATGGNDPNTKQAATCTFCGGEKDDPKYVAVQQGLCQSAFHSAHPVSAEGWTLYRFTNTVDGTPTEWRVAPRGGAPTPPDIETVEVVPEARAAEAERNQDARLRQFLGQWGLWDHENDRYDRAKLHEMARLYRESVLTPKHPQDKESGG